MSMPPENRLELAKQTALEKRSALLASNAPPCSTCIHRVDIPTNHIDFEIHCGHVAVANAKYDRITGQLKTTPFPADRARMPHGLCGPEGVLHEAKRLSIGDKINFAYLGGIGLFVVYLVIFGQ